MIELPFPAKILWPNGRGHHMKKHREFQKHKSWAFLATKAFLSLPTEASFEGFFARPIAWTATFYPKTANTIDDDNARSSLKAFQDGIAAALGIDDKHFAAPTVQFGEPVKGGKVVITIGESA
jgi:crossover junction endodeoxyribonuclease RusA